MKNTLLISLLLSFILFGCASNTTTIFKSSMTNEEIFQKKTECRDICKTLYEEDKKVLPNNTVMNPQYAYNEQENACFYAGGWIDVQTQGMTKRVINCQTNKEVLTYILINDNVFTSHCDTCVSSIYEYNQKEKELLWE